MNHQSPGPASERRAQPRVKCNVVFTGARVSARGQLSAPADISVLDISAGGLRFISQLAFDIGDEAVVEMSGKGGPPRLVGLTIVRHAETETGLDTFGARFMSMRADVLRAAS